MRISLRTFVTLLETNGVAADQLTLEITETALVADLELARRSTMALRSLGVRISVDDFGVGYSSMAELIGLTIDELKIDKSFVTELEHRLSAGGHRPRNHRTRVRP